MNQTQEIHSDKQERNFLFIILLCGWFSLFAQFYLVIKDADNLWESVLRFFSYFTILTNLLVSVCCTVLLFNSNTRLKNFFSKASTLTAITVYILVVALIYNLVLRKLWQPHHLQEIVDEMLHVVNPVLFLFFWIFFVPKQSLKWSYAAIWLVYPVAYMIYTLIKGAVTKFYPYPFIDITAIGLYNALRNGLLVLLTFYILSLLLIAIGKAKK